MKWLFAILVIIVLFIGAYFAMPEWFSPGTGGTNTSSTGTSTASDFETYESVTHGLSFRYPDSYVLEERDTDEQPSVHVITIAPRTALENVPQGGEGPPSIAISIFSATTTSAEAWVRESIASNFQLSLNGTLSSTTVDGVHAVRYTSDGLYATENVVLIHESKAYMFSVGWIDRADRIVSDFEQLMASVRLE